MCLQICCISSTSREGRSCSYERIVPVPRERIIAETIYGRIAIRKRSRWWDEFRCMYFFLRLVQDLIRRGRTHALDTEVVAADDAVASIRQRIFDSVPTKFRNHEQSDDMGRGESRYASVTTRFKRTAAQQNRRRQRRHPPNTKCTRPHASSANCRTRRPHAHTFFDRKFEVCMGGGRRVTLRRHRTRFDKRK